MIKDIQKINVFYRSEFVGTIGMDPGTHICIFEYDKGWLSNGFSLSPTELPLKNGLFVADQDLFRGGFATFEDSLPDGYGLYLLDRLLKKNGSSLEELSPLQRLAIIGNSGMGALSYKPAMNGFLPQKEIESIEQLDVLQTEAIRLFSEKGTGDASLLYYNSANSGGARPKAAFRTKDGRHWLVKFRHFYDAIDCGKTELLYMITARKCGINIPQIGLIKDKYFCIERFDLDPDGTKHHVLTAAALLKTNFRNQDVDYTNLLALTGYLTQDPVQVEEMFRRMVMNLIADNKDDHAKNFSFICEDGKWTLAPAYDITYSPSGSNGQHATSLFYDGNPDLSLVLKAGVDIRIPRERCVEIIEQVQTVCKESLPTVEPLIEDNCERSM